MIVKNGSRRLLHCLVRFDKKPMVAYSITQRAIIESLDVCFQDLKVSCSPKTFFDENELVNFVKKSTPSMKKCYKEIFRGKV